MTFQSFHGQIGKIRFVTRKQGSEYTQDFCIEFCIHIPFVVFATHNLHLNLESEIFKGELSVLAIFKALSLQ